MDQIDKGYKSFQEGLVKAEAMDSTAIGKVNLVNNLFNDVSRNFPLGERKEDVGSEQIQQARRVLTLMKNTSHRPYNVKHPEIDRVMEFLKTDSPDYREISLQLANLDGAITWA